MIFWVEVPTQPIRFRLLVSNHSLQKEKHYELNSFATKIYSCTTVNHCSSATSFTFSLTAQYAVFLETFLGDSNRMLSSALDIIAEAFNDNIQKYQQQI